MRQILAGTIPGRDRHRSRSDPYRKTADAVDQNFGFCPVWIPL